VADPLEAPKVEKLDVGREELRLDRLLCEQVGAEVLLVVVGDEIPTPSPKRLASFCAMRIASPSSTATTPSSASSETIGGMNSSEMPWMRCFPTR
jgi:hypothetical protein